MWNIGGKNVEYGRLGVKNVEYGILGVKKCGIWKIGG